MTLMNRWCQLADFRERGGLSFELRAVASESDSPSGRSAIYYDAQFPSLSVRTSRLRAHTSRSLRLYERILHNPTQGIAQ